MSVRPAGLGESDESQELDQKTFVHNRTLRDLEQKLYGHVLDAIDFGVIGGLETQLYGLLCDLEIDDELALDLSKLVISRALERAIEDTSRYCNFGAPEGVSKAEVRAVAFDESCVFCVAEAADAAYASENPDDGEDHGHGETESCALCDDLVRMWRKQNAEKLRKHGLGPVADKPDRSPPSPKPRAHGGVS